MIPEVNIISGEASIESANSPGGSGGTVNSSVGIFRLLRISRLA